MLQGCRLIKLCLNLPAGHCVAGVQTVLAVLETTCWALCCRRAGCLSGVGTYLLGTVMQGCKLFQWCLNLPARHCIVGVQAVLALSEPTSWTLCCSGAGDLSGVGTYLPGTVLEGCRLFQRCPNLPAGHCVAGVQAV